MPAELKALIKEFLAAHTTMTLATLGADGSPQAAALFYAEMDGLSLVFTSEPKTRHSRNLARAWRVAVTIQTDGQDWREIQGLQIEGVCRRLDGPEKEAAYAAYVQKFPFIQRSAQLGSLLRLSAFYQVNPDWIRLIDNSKGLGHKEEWLKGAASF